MRFKLLVPLITFLLMTHSFAGEDKKVIGVGSKVFTESYVLGEIISQLLESRGYSVNRNMGLAGTAVAFQALKEGSIHVYVEYTGTLYEAIYKMPRHDLHQLKLFVAKDDLEMLPSLGFANNYSLVVPRGTREKHNLKTISDLKDFPHFAGGTSHEFLKRNDGWPSLKKVYGLNNSIRGMEHALAYEAIGSGKIDFSEAYTTDPAIKKFDLVPLEDDKKFFPTYQALPLVRKDMPEKAKEAIELLKNSITNEEMIVMNDKATEGMPFANVAREFLLQKGLVSKDSKFSGGFSGMIPALVKRTKEHLYLTFLAVLFATLFAIPLAVFIQGNKTLAQPILSFAGLLQTIPSIALLTLMIPLFGIGFLPALIGLFLYSLLPILRNTYTALITIDPRIITAAKGIGLHPSEVFWSVKLPLSLPVIITGIRTATIINIGTATLAAFIGAGGLGEPIVTGLALNDVGIILQGAIPAALLAIVVDGLFSWGEKVFAKTL